MKQKIKLINLLNNQHQRIEITSAMLNINTLDFKKCVYIGTSHFKLKTTLKIMIKLLVGLCKFRVKNI